MCFRFCFARGLRIEKSDFVILNSMFFAVLLGTIYHCISRMVLTFYHGFVGTQYSALMLTDLHFELGVVSLLSVRLIKSVTDFHTS